MKSIKYSIIDFLKTTKVGKPIYRTLKNYRNNSAFKIEDLKAIIPIPENGDEVRYNLVLPTLRKSKVFGGILTAIKILNILSEKAGVKARIIVVSEEKYNSKWTYQITNYGYNDKLNNQLLFLGEPRKLNVKKNDVYILTSWRTAYLMFPVLFWQIRSFNLTGRKMVYLIQDYEPGFYPWSTEYLLAESTYKTSPEKIIALYNSKELFDFFQSRNYSFSDQFYFEPILNEELKLKLLSYGEYKKEKKILIYGRPSEYRNAFEIIKGALIIWSMNYPGAKEWSIISLGEEYKEIQLENNIIRVHGKVSLSDYAEVLRSSYAGISLMVSPHPSYPPLEMSTFGIKTITNAFENKDLSTFNPNIISLQNCTPVAIAEKLAEICDDFEGSETLCYSDNDYLIESNFETSINEIGDILNGVIQKD